MNAQQEQNLRNVARALRESPRPDMFHMGLYGHPCGTPACALGHYAARPDLNGGRLVLAENEEPLRPRWIPRGEMTLTDRLGYIATYCDWIVQYEFGLSGSEAHALFNGHDGCGGAKTATEAADYIEAFIARKRATR